MGLYDFYFFVFGFFTATAFWRWVTVYRQAKRSTPVDTEALMTSAVANAIHWGRSHLGNDAMKLLPAEKIAERWWESGKVNK
ncbi:hypothetical protein [Weissella confusa]|uniref:hypothetical protein n=1 Tax=Weissella confusa TaxID=1583 RepID=UPI00107FD0B5|nr:hypothetical protein [Weissella confusa]MBJ7656254.1 hypothetical protein [Weissella confusa]TGE44147.1 hypothetical protein C6P25_04305 [Weissella confusa]